MASKINYSAALEAARANAITTRIGDNAKLWIYSGAQPAGPDASPGSASLLAGPFILAAPFAPPASLATPSILLPTPPALNVSATGTGTPTWYRVTGSDGTTGFIDGSAGVSGCDLTIGGTTSGQPVAITYWRIESANYGHV